MGPQPAVAAVRRAVRASLSGLEPGDLLLAACSGGADSLALAAALAFEAPRAGMLAGAVTVDHGLQAGSARQAEAVAEALARLGLDPVLAVTVQVAGPDAETARHGPEAAARSARYAAFDRVIEETRAAAVLLGHTLDDQAETVLLGLGRGSGARSLAGMRPRSNRYLRPLLGVRREQTSAACVALGLMPWTDPQNSDQAFTRVRVRQDLMPALERALGPGAAVNLARTAELLRADADVLDGIAAGEVDRLGGSEAALSLGWLVADLGRLPDAIRHRVLRMGALAAGCPAGALAARHVASIDDLVTTWHGQRWTDLPGGVRCQRGYGRLLFSRAGAGGRRQAEARAAPSAVTAARSEDPGGRQRHGRGPQGDLDHAGAVEPAHS